MSLRDGECKQIAHHGDNHLGGKNIDWALVDELLLPAVRNDLGWTDIARGTGADPRWRGSIAKLKAAAEDAKITLSGLTATDVVVDLRHPDGRSDTLGITIARADLERISTPFHRRTVELSRTALDSAGLGPRDIARTVLVGGPTHAPGLTELLADPVDGLGTAIDRGIDPVIAVVRGAAVYAATRLRPAPVRPAVARRAWCTLSFEPVSDDPTPLVGGTMSGPLADWSGCTVLFRNPSSRPPWEGPRLAVRRAGTFTAELCAQDGTNTYTIELSDPGGSRIPVTPDTLVYRLDPQVPADHTVLPDSIGIVRDDGLVEWVARAGTDVHRGQRTGVTVRTPATIRSGGEQFTVAVVQGENDRADRNRRVGTLTITAAAVPRDVPAGTPVDIEVRIDATQTVTAEAYLPLFEQVWQAEFDAGRTPRSAGVLAGWIAEVERRVADLESRAATAVDPGSRHDLAALRPGERLAEIRRLQAGAADDPADADSCETLLLDLQVELDRVEDSVAHPATGGAEPPLDRIDVGIHLGATDSAVAVCDGSTVDIVRNNDNTELTPSAVWISPSGSPRVGRRARERAGVDPQNAVAGFTDRLGVDDGARTFAASGVTMTPEQLATEILASLVRDVATRRDEEVDVAVVTVPAAADPAGVDAVVRAAGRAGITARTVPEPEAAAIAHLDGDPCADGGETWLVHHLGDGRFDATVLDVRPGLIARLSHVGDGGLGDAIVAGAVVEHVLVPEVHRELGWTDLTTGADAWRGTVAALTAAAQDAIVALRASDRTDVVVGLRHPNGRSGDVEVALTRDELDRLAAPSRRDSVRAGLRALRTAGLAPSDLARVVLVGPGTLDPGLRALLAGRTDGYGARIDHRLDPSTSVVRGAALLAGTMSRDTTGPPDGTPAVVDATAGAPVERDVPDEGPTVVTSRPAEAPSEPAAPADTTPGPTPDPARPIAATPGPTPDPADGTTVVTARPDGSAAAGSAAEPVGRVVDGPTDPAIPRRPAPPPAVLPASIGLALSRQRVLWLAREGTNVAGGHRNTVRVRTPSAVSPGGSDRITVTVVQGDHERADRNRVIGRLEVTGDQVGREVPAGTELEITLAVDVTGRPEIDVALPGLHRRWRVDLRLAGPDRSELVSMIAQAERRLGGLDHRLTRARAELDRLAQKRITEIHALLATADRDRSDARACESRLYDLQVALDRLEDGLR